MCDAVPNNTLARHAGDNCLLRAKQPSSRGAAIKQSCHLDSDSGICSTFNEKLQDTLSRADSNCSSRRSSAYSSAYSSIQASPETARASSCFEGEARVGPPNGAMAPTAAAAGNCEVSNNTRIESTCDVHAAVNARRASHPASRRSRFTSSASSVKSSSSYTEENRRLVDPVSKTVYVKKRLLGKGGFARVYEVHQSGCEVRDITCAAKVIDKSRISRPHQREKVDLEVQLLREARGHPNIVGFYHSFEDDSCVCILQELCNKKSLAQYLRRKQYLSEQEVCNITQQVVAGLGHLHSKGIIHRDLKLGNILLTDDMVVKIGDFGLATRTEAAKKKTICGTPNFIAPEVLQRQGHGPEADIWALGCLLYTMLVGRPPFETSCLRDTYHCILKNNYRIPATMSPEAADLVRWMLRHKPKSRPTLDEISAHPFFSKHSTYLKAIKPANSKSYKAASDLAAMFSGMRLENVSAEEANNTLSVPAAINVAPISPLYASDNTRIAEESVASVKVACNYDSASLEAKRQPASAPVAKLKSPVKRLTSKIQERLSKLPSPARCVRSGRSSSEKNTKEQGSISATLNAEPSTNIPMTWVSKWVDYSNRYGFGYQLASGRICVLFNDGKHLSMLPEEKIMEYSSGDRTGVIRFSTDGVPASLERYANMLRNFTSYMEKNLSRASGMPTTDRPLSSARLLTWRRTDEYVAMYFSDGTLQVNFCRNHVKMNISNLHKQSTMRFTVVDEMRNFSTFDRHQMLTVAPPNIRRHLVSVHSYFHSIFADVNCDAHPFCAVCSLCDEACAAGSR